MEIKWFLDSSTGILLCVIWPHTSHNQRTGNITNNTSHRSLLASLRSSSHRTTGWSRFSALMKKLFKLDQTIVLFQTAAFCSQWPWATKSFVYNMKKSLWDIRVFLKCSSSHLLDSMTRSKRKKRVKQKDDQKCQIWTMRILAFCTDNKKHICI